MIYCYQAMKVARVGISAHNWLWENITISRVLATTGGRALFRGLCHFRGIMTKDLRTIDDLVPDIKNANRGTQRGRKVLEDSLRELGAARSIVVDKNGVIVAGNKTAEVAADLDLPVRIVRTNGHELIVVQREDWDIDDGSGARKYAYADNRTQELDLNWDDERLAIDLDAGLDLSDLWVLSELGMGPEVDGQAVRLGREDKTYHLSIDLDYADSLLVRRAIEEAGSDANVWILGAASSYLKGQWK